MGEVRLPPLDELGLPDGTPVEAVYHADRKKPPLEQRKLLGRLVDGLIVLVEGAEAGAAERRVDARDFLAAAGYGARFTNPYLHIRLPEQGGIPLAQHAQGGASNEQQRIAGLLEREYRVASLGDLWQYVEAHPLDGKVYRVCRLNETEIDTRGLTSNGGLRSWWRQAGAAPAAATRFVQDINTHIRNGSRPDYRSLGFISATRDLHTALSWGYGGCHTIVAIDVRAAAAAGVRAYDMGGSLNNLCSPMVCHFAASSAEVIFDRDIPAHCVTVLQAHWTPLGDRLLSSRTGAQPFPQQLRRQDIEVLEELQEGTSKPLRVKVDLAQDSKKKPPLGTQAERPQYVLKRGGGAGGTSRNSHIVSEFTAMTMYARAGLKVPQAALYTVKVAVESENVEAVVKYLLIEWLDGERPKLSDFNSVLVAQFRRGIALDVALSNADAAGPAFANLLVVEQRNRKQLYRIDFGGCGFFDFAGKRKPMFLFEQTNPSDLQRTFRAMRGQDRNGASGALAASVLPVSSALQVSAAALPDNDALKAEEALEFLMLNTRLVQLASGTRGLRPQLQSELMNWLATDRACTSETVVDTVTRALARLISLERCSQVDALPPPPRFDAQQLLGIAVVKRSRAIANNQPGGYKADFVRDYLEQGYEVWDVTSNGNHPRLSPFTAVGQYSIPVPGQANKYAKCVEGIWQGLKVFPGYEQNPRLDVDPPKFAITNGRKLKRKGKPEGHAWNGENGDEPRQLLGYVEARRKIYLPAFYWVIENVPAVRHEVAKLARAATQTKIVLLDYFSNDQVENVAEPLSHAGLLRQYIRDNWRRLLGLAEPPAAAAAAGAAAEAAQPAGMPAVQRPMAAPQYDGPETSAAAAARTPVTRSFSGRRPEFEATPAAREAPAVRPKETDERPSAQSLQHQVHYDRAAASLLQHHLDRPSDVLPAAAAEVITGGPVDMREQAAPQASPSRRQQQARGVSADLGAAMDAAASPVSRGAGPSGSRAAAAPAAAAAAAGVHVLSSAAGVPAAAAAIIAAGGPDGGWLSNEDVKSLLTHHETWRLPISDQLMQQPRVGDMLLVTTGCVRSGLRDGLVWQTEIRANGQRAGQHMLWRRSGRLTLDGTRLGYWAKNRTADGTMERRVYNLDSEANVRLLHYHRAAADQQPANKRKASELEAGEEQAPAAPAQRASTASAAAAAPAAAATAAAPAGSAAAGAGASGPCSAGPSGTRTDAAPAPASAPAARGAAARGAAAAPVAPGVHVLSNVAGVPAEAAAIITAGGPDGGWLSNEQVVSLLTHHETWRLPISTEAKQQPLVGDMLLATTECVQRRWNDGLVWQMTTRSDTGQEMLKRNNGPLKVEGTRLGYLTKYYTADGTMERRVYSLDAQPGVRLVHYHRAAANPQQANKKRKASKLEAGEERASLPPPAPAQRAAPASAAAPAGAAATAAAGGAGIGASAARTGVSGSRAAAPTVGVQVLSSAAGVPAEAAAIIAAGGPAGGWLSGEQVQALLARHAEWHLPISGELKQRPQVGDMLLIKGRLIAKGIDDGLVWATEQRSNGNQPPVRRSDYFKGKHAAAEMARCREAGAIEVGTQAKYFTADGKVERRVYKLKAQPDLRLLHYHRTPPGGPVTKKQKVTQAGAADSAAEATAGA